MRTVMVSLIVALAALSASAEDNRRLIFISAQSEVVVTPDEAVISFTITNRDPSLVVAKTGNDRLTTGVAKVFAKQALPAELVKVTNMDLGPYHDKEDKLLGYRVQRTFEVTIRDFAKVDPTIAGIVEAAGDNVSIQSLRYVVQNQRQHQIEARRLAVEIAREKATHLAELNHMRLGNAIYISEDVEHNRSSVASGGGFVSLAPKRDALAELISTEPASAKRPMIQVANAEKGAAPPDMAPSKNAPATEKGLLLSPGQVGLNAQVGIVFELVEEK